MKEQGPYLCPLLREAFPQARLNRGLFLFLFFFTSESLEEELGFSLSSFAREPSG